MLKIVMGTGETVPTLRFEGPIDAHAAGAFQAWAPTLPPKSLVFDLGGVSAINSLGARLWTEFVAEATRDRKIVLDNCPMTFVEYASLITGFIGNAAIRTLNVPIACGNCGSRLSRTMTVTDLKAPGALQSEVCGKCGETCEPETDIGELVESLEGIS